MVFFVSACVFFDRGGKTLLLQRALLLPAEDETQAHEIIETWLNDNFPGPAYYGHEFEAHPLEGVTMKGSMIRFPSRP
jgi:hypothetical protein